MEDHIEVRDVVFALAFLNREETAVGNDVPLGRIDAGSPYLMKRARDSKG